MSEQTIHGVCASLCRIQKNARRAFFQQTKNSKSLGRSSQENGNESQHENQYGAANRQNDVHQRNDGLNHIGGFSVV
jgi:hypothetical protein